MFPDGRIVLVALAGVLSMAVPARAQEQRGSRLPGGLFGSGFAAESGQSLTAAVSAGAGHHSATRGPAGSTLSGESRSFGHAAGNLRYSFAGTRLSVWAGAASSLHYYSGALQQLPARHVADAGVSVGVPMSGRTTLNLAQTARYRPLQSVSVLPGVSSGLGADPALPIDPDLATTSAGYFSLDSSASLNHSLSRQSAVAFHAGYRQSGPVSSESDLSEARGGLRFTRQMSRHLSLRTGYSYTRGTYEAAGQPAASFDHHHIDAGAAYDRAVSLTRRTTFSFSTGSVVVTDGVRHRFDVNGQARLGYDIGRTWQASVVYRRATEFIATLRAPVSADSLVASLGGFLGGRVHGHATVGTVRGNVGLARGNGFTTSYATAGLTVGLAANLGMDFSYSFLRADYTTPGLLAPGLPAQFDRQSVRASLRLWLPLFTVVRRPNAAG